MSTVTPPTGPTGDSGRAHDADGPEDGTAAHTHADDARPRRRSRGGGWLEYVVTMAGALVIAVLVKTFLIQPFYIPSESMLPTLEVNDKIIVSKLSPGVFDLERGDVIVFEDPADWLGGEGATGTDEGLRARVLKVLSLVGLAPDPSQNHLVKRLIGLPGDHVACAEQGGQLTVNGVVVDEPYIEAGSEPCQTTFDVTVPADSLWVMGDNRYNSADSSYHYSTCRNEDPSSDCLGAYVPVEDVTGRAVVVFWPIAHWSGLGAGEDAFADVPDPS